MDNIIGVITGDIINSSSIEIDNRDTLLKVIRSSFDVLKTKIDKELKYELYRGDSFQLITSRPESALKIAILIRANLIRSTPKDSQVWDARISIGIGTSSFNSDTPLVSDGIAFKLSGRELDEMKKSKLTITTMWECINKELQVSTKFADDIISNWTPLQAHLVYLSLINDETQKEIAKKEKKTPQAISKTLNMAKENLIKIYIERFENLIHNQLQTSL